MDTGDAMPAHVLLVPDVDPSESLLTITDAEATHAVRAKRVRPGESVLVLSGAGLEVDCEVVEAKRALTLRVRASRRVEPASPRVSVCGATPKGPRVGDMIDALSQVGAASWSALRTDLGVVDPGAGKLERLERIAAESAKQCRRAWKLHIGSPMSVEEALRASPGERVVVADASGEPLGPGGGDTRLLVGPEGGWTARELDAARAAGATVASFGPHAMRIEVAAAVATAIVICMTGAAGRR